MVDSKLRTHGLHARNFRRTFPPLTPTYSLFAVRFGIHTNPRPSTLFSFLHPTDADGAYRVDVPPVNQ